LIIIVSPGDLSPLIYYLRHSKALILTRFIIKIFFLSICGISFGLLQAQEEGSEPQEDTKVVEEIDLGNQAIRSSVDIEKIGDQVVWAKPEDCGCGKDNPVVIENLVGFEQSPLFSIADDGGSYLAFVQGALNKEPSIQSVESICQKLSKRIEHLETDDDREQRLNNIGKEINLWYHISNFNLAQLQTCLSLKLLPLEE